MNEYGPAIGVLACLASAVVFVAALVIALDFVGVA